MTKSEIIKWLNKYKVFKYTINDDLTIDVDGDVVLYNKQLTSIPVKFNKVNGYFYCAYNNLTTLEGCPKEVNGYFDCYNNKLTTLEGCPKVVNGNFDCSNNKLSIDDDRSIDIKGKFICNEEFKVSKTYKRYMLIDKMSKITN